MKLSISKKKPYFNFDKLLLEIKLNVLGALCFIITFRFLRVLLFITLNILVGDTFGHPNDEGAVIGDQDLEQQEDNDAGMDKFLDEVIADSAFEKERAVYDEELRKQHEAGASDLNYREASAKKSNASSPLFDRYRANQHSLLFDLHCPMDEIMEEDQVQPASDYELKD